MPFSIYKTTRLKFIFFVYWFLLLYIIAALVWWFIALYQQNNLMAAFEISQLKMDTPDYTSQLAAIDDFQRRKRAQYIGEGSIFLLLILSCAVFIYRAVKRQFTMAQQQQNLMMAITHELKTPIAIAKLNLETLQKHKLEEGQQQKLIYNTIQEANRLNALCNNMLLASQMDAGEYSITKEELSLTKLVTDCVNDFITRYPQRAFKTIISEDVYIIGDVLMLQMAVNNLLDNAIKYSPKETLITILLEQNNKQATLIIKDEGKGIENVEKKKVFDKFYRIGNTATKAAKGTGLGLYLTRKIAAQHNATIFVTDNIPTGSNFTMVFSL